MKTLLLRTQFKLELSSFMIYQVSEHKRLSPRPNELPQTRRPHRPALHPSTRPLLERLFPFPSPSTHPLRPPAHAAPFRWNDKTPPHSKTISRLTFIIHIGSRSTGEQLWSLSTVPCSFSILATENALPPSLLLVLLPRNCESNHCPTTIR